MVEVLALMDAIVAAIVTVVVGGLGYLLGNRRMRYERLYAQRAEVLSTLGSLLYKVQRGFVTFTSLLQYGDPDRKEQLEEANRLLRARPLLLLKRDVAGGGHLLEDREVHSSSPT